MPDRPPARGLLDTSVVIDLERITPGQLPDELAIASLTMAKLAAGRKARGRRAVDLLIAATAVTAGLPVYTRNPDDFEHLDGLVVIAVSVSD